MSRRKKNTPPTPVPSLSAQQTALEQFRVLLPPDEFLALLEELERPLLPAFRINPLKTTSQAVADWCEWYGWQVQPVAFCPTGWQVRQARTPLSQTLEHRFGHYYIQDAASMLPAELFDLPASPHPLILDMAASPGGKTTHLISRTLDRGLTLANDAGLERITPLRLVLQNWGTVNTAVTRFPAEKFGRWFPGVFDWALLDAPCSMQSLRPTESHPMRPISPREQSHLARRQTAMLISALAAVKPGGQVVYSTCTLAPQEDEAVLDEVLRRLPNAVQVDSVSNRLPQPAPALTTAFGQTFHPQVQNALRLWPHRFSTSGFFAARLTRTDEMDLPTEPHPARPLRETGQEPLNRPMAQEIAEWLKNTYHFDLTSVLETYRLELWRSQASIFAVPTAFLETFDGLPCQMLGLKVLEDTPQGWQPAHEWVNRFAHHFQSGCLSLPDEMLDEWLKGKDVPMPLSAGTPPPVWIVFDERNRFIGRGRSSGIWLKNLLPRRGIG
ncbi:MAG: hypothetical protein ACK4SN_12715 [Bellilinea sp.]